MLGQPFVHTEKHLLSNPAGSDCSLMHFSMWPVAPGSDEHPFSAVNPWRGCPPVLLWTCWDKWHEAVFGGHLGMWREGGEANWAQLCPKNTQFVVPLSLVSHIPPGRGRGEAPLGQGPAAPQQDLGSGCRENQAHQGQDLQLPKVRRNLEVSSSPSDPLAAASALGFHGSCPCYSSPPWKPGGVLGEKGELPGQNCGQLAEFSTPALPRC